MRPSRLFLEQEGRDQENAREDEEQVDPVKSADGLAEGVHAITPRIARPRTPSRAAT